MYNVAEETKLQFCGHCGRRLALKRKSDYWVKVCPRYENLFNPYWDYHDLHVVGDFIPEKRFDTTTGEKL